MYSPLRIDIGIRDLLAGLVASLQPQTRLERRLGRAAGWRPPADALELLSVRSGLDLLLSALGLPLGSEVLVSAVTIPDMVRIIEAHGLTPVAVDIDPHTLLPDAQQLEQRLSGRARMLLLAHLFGSYNDLRDSADYCRRHNLLLVEDCAQCFSGPDFQGSEQAMASLFSFGPIKRATALGGAIAYVRDAAVRKRMQRLLADYPAQSAHAYRARLVKYFALVLLSRPRIYGALLRALTWLGRDPQQVLRESVRGFAGSDLTLVLRRRPGLPLRWMLRRRLTRFDGDRLERHCARLDALAAALPGGLRLAGRGATRRTHWVFPLRSAAPLELVERLRAHGLDATQAASSLQALGPPEAVPQAVELLRSLVYVPCYEDVPTDLLERVLR